MQRILELVCLFALLVVIGLRPLVAETYDSAGDPISNALDVIENPSPLRTLVFDVVILAAGCGWLLTRAIGRPRAFRPTGLEVGAAVLCVAAIGSCFLAGNKRLAVNGAIDWLCYAVMAIVLVQLLHTPLRRALLLAVVLASASAQALECAEQHFFSFRDTWTEYERIKPEFWARQGVAPDSPKAILFEQRLKSAEANGHLSHSNVTGSYLVLCGLAAAGLAIARLRQGTTAAPAPLESARAETLSPRAALTPLLALAILGATVLTSSRGAMAAALLACALWVSLAWIGPRLAMRRRATLITLWAIAALGVVAVVVAARASSPGSSLHFRWQYWTASARMIADHPVFGVGAENFGRHYTQYKSIDSAEEIANPHNLFVHAATSWGLIGLAGLVAMFIGVTMVVVRRDSTRNTAPSDETPGPAGRAAIVTACAALAVAVHAVRAALLGSDEPNYIFYATTMCGLAWLAGLAIVLPGRGESVISAPAVRLGVIAALAAFLVHDLINFALFVPGTAATFFALLAFLISGTPAPAADGEVPRPRRIARIAVVAVASAALVVLFAGVVAPVGQAGAYLRGAEYAAYTLDDVEAEAFRRDTMFMGAGLADPLDPTPPARRAQWWASIWTHPKIGVLGLNQAKAALDQAVARDPFEGSLRRLGAQILLARGASGGAMADYVEAAAAADAALSLYPQDPAAHVLVGDTNLAWGKATGDTQPLRRAAEAFREALRLDGARPTWEIIRRYSAADRAAIEAKARDAERAGE